MVGTMRWFVAAAALSVVAAPAVAQTAPADEEIVVRADGDQVRIDRQVYVLRNDPVAQSTDMFDVLGRVPSVSIDASGAVTLLGAGAPTIQINGQALSKGASVEQVLRGLQGADVERIEVNSNPSAQFSSATSGGIINIITRRQHRQGFSGNANASADSFGGVQASVAPSWSEGPWSVGGRLGHHGAEVERDTQFRRDDLTSGAVTTENGRSSNEFRGDGGSLQVGYQRDPKNKLSLNLDSYAGNGESSQIADRITDLVPVYHQDQQGGFDYRYNGLGLQWQHDGARPREQLRLDGEYWSNGFSNDRTVTLEPLSGPGAASAFLARTTSDVDSGKFTADYDLPFGETNLLTVGISVEAQRQHVDNLQRTILGPPSPSDFQSALTAHELTLAGYGTYQFAWGDWSFLPGLRIENYDRKLSAAAGTSTLDDTQLFPTLHVRRTFDHIDADLSYTRRIERPDIDALDPALRFSDATHAQAGNSGLEASIVDAYEARFSYQERGQTYSLTVFDRVSHDIVSPLVSDVGGVTVFTQTNAGDSEQIGAEAIMRGTFGPHWRYTTSANALNNSFDVLRGGSVSRDSAFEYSGSASLEYHDVNQNDVGADNLQFEVRVQGPRHMLQQETDASYYASLSWRRRLSDRLFGFVQVADVFATREFRQTSRGDDFIERSVQESPGARVRVSLTYQFGAQSDRPPPPPSESGGAPR